jgi:carbamoyl-phosphate synthase large subunit
LPSLEKFEERNKSNLPTYGEKYGVNVPAGTDVFSISDLDNTLKSMNYPVMIKGKYYDAYKAYSPEQVVSKKSSLSFRYLSVSFPRYGIQSKTLKIKYWHEVF